MILHRHDGGLRDGAHGHAHHLPCRGMAGHLMPEVEGEVGDVLGGGVLLEPAQRRVVVVGPCVDDVDRRVVV